MELQDLVKTIFGTVLRHGASAIGVILVSKGYVTADEAAALTDYLVGGGLIVIAAIASYVFKKKAIEAQPPIK